MNMIMPVEIGAIVFINMLKFHKDQEPELYYSQIAQETINRKAAKIYEGKLKLDNDNLEFRILLLGFYFKKHLKSKHSMLNRNKHVIWAIKNLYDSKILKFLFPYIRVYPEYQPEFFRFTSDLWFEILLLHPDKPQVFINVANAMGGFSSEIKRELLQKASKLDPDNLQLKKYISILDDYAFQYSRLNLMHRNQLKRKLKKVEDLNQKYLTLIKSL